MDTKEYFIGLLKQKQAELQAKGDDRYPRRSDFSEREVMGIKAHLGPWPRALEAAELKPSDAAAREEKRLQRRIEAKRRKTAEKIKKQASQSAKDAADPANSQSFH